MTRWLNQSLAHAMKSCRFALLAQVWIALADQVEKAGGVLPSSSRSEETLTDGVKGP
jgi:hypothetical protein